MKQHLRGWLAGTTWLLVAAAGACNTAEPVTMGNAIGGTAPAGAAAGAPSPTAGVPSAAAGAPSATGGTIAAAGGTLATGAAGTTAGAAGTPGGSATSNMSCGPASTLPGPMLHDMAKGYLLPKPETPMSPCAFGSCHTEKIKKGQLVLDLTLMDLKGLVGKPSCEAPALKLVDATGGDTALAKSWLWLKLVGKADASNILVSDPSWGAPGACGQMSGQEYGVRMPYGSAEWEENKLAAVKAWICAGAPGPM